MKAYKNECKFMVRWNQCYLGLLCWLLSMVDVYGALTIWCVALTPSVLAQRCCVACIFISVHLVFDGSTMNGIIV